MFVTRKWIGSMCLGVAGGVLVSPALAQTAIEQPTGQSTVERATQATPGGVPRTTPQASSAGQDQVGANLNQQIAVCLTLGNQEEVALAQFAEQRSQNPEVKKFAKQMIEHHQQAIAKIQQAAPETAGLKLQLQSKKAAQAAATSEDSGVRPASAEEPVAAAGTAHKHQAVQMAQQIKQECLNLTQHELSQKQGVEFDKAYMGQQVAAHLGMLAELRGSKDFASGELQQVIGEGEQMTQKHLAEAKQIMSQLKDQRGAQPPQTSQRPGTTAQPTR